VRLLPDPVFDDILRTFEESAFHLEVQDTYHSTVESDPFRRFLDGVPDDFGWLQPWLHQVRLTTESGRHIERVRVVSVPHGDYTRWSLTLTPHNIEAGEDIRWLPRGRTAGLDVAADDFWLIDRKRLVFSVFAPDGEFAGWVESADRATIDRCVRMRDALWSAAVPHADYK
jgi:hypothetical protein